MPIKKSDLYSSLWASCDELRGGMDASLYKDYVLFMLFIKYVSDKYGDSDDFAPAVVIPKGSSFKDMVALKGKSDIGDKINTQIIQPLIEANDRLARSDFPDFNDPNKLGQGDEMVQRLSNLIGIFQKPELDFSQNRAEHDDILGDAYEYLMRHFATESGKSKGQFYTPAEVSRVIAKVIGISPQNTVAATTVYDPTCGSGSLLLKVAAEAGRHITLEGQEKDVTTAGLARMNMILHDFPTANVATGNTLANPRFRDGEQLRTYDYVVANPPFSDKAWSTGLKSPDEFQRFGWGEPPKKQGDYAYLLHIIRSLKGTGKAACILPHGVLFRGGAEGTIRRELMRSGYLKGIIGLPANLFYGTGIPACVVVLDKENAPARKGIFMIDASKGFIKDGNKNRLREQDIHRIIDTFSKQTDVPRYARMVPFDEIAGAKNDFNLNLPRYIDSTEPEDIQDIDGHLRGGIPQRDLDALADYWQVLPGVRSTLFSSVQPAGAALPEGMHPAYAETHFQRAEHWTDWPPQFAIITAYATTGERWTDEQNAAADRQLEAELTARGIWLRRLTGLSPSTGHAEPGWAAEMDIHTTCEIGRRYRQDAIYHVAGDTLSVLRCDSPDAPALVGPFRCRVHIAPGKPGIRPGYARLAVPIAEVKATIFGHAEFSAFVGGVTNLFAKWREVTVHLLKDFARDGHPKPLIEATSESLLATFKAAPLLDAYDVYQHLMDYWAETMQDDCYLIAADGWREAAQPRLIVEDKTKKAKAKPDFVLGRKKYQTELIPPALIIRRWFVDEQAAIEKLESDIAALQQQIEELAEEHGGEDGLLAEAANDKGKLTKASVTARLKEIKGDAEAADEIKLLKEYLALVEREAATSAQFAAAQLKLTEQVAARYPELTEEEIKTLVVDDKWLATIAAAVQGELDRVSQTLTGRIRQLAERYATPLPQIMDEVAALAARVDGHLKKMGAVWN